MYSSTPFPFESLFTQQSLFPPHLHFGLQNPLFGQNLYQNPQNLGQFPLFGASYQHQPQFTFSQVPAGAFGSQTPQSSQNSAALEELMRDRQRDIYLDGTILKLLESSRLYRHSDSLLQSFVEGKTLPKEKAVKNLLADRQKDQDIAAIISSIVNERKDRAIDQIMANMSLGIPVTASTFAAKQQKQKAFDQEIEQAVRNLMNRDTAVFGISQGLGGYMNDPLANL